MGTWENFDCAGAEAPVVGTVRRAGEALTLCRDGLTCPLGMDWLFQLNLESSLFTLFRNDGDGWIIHLNQKRFELVPGACALAPARFDPEKPLPDVLLFAR